MKVCVFGSGYVGLVAGACFAESGNEVICVDIDQTKVELLNSGGVPIYEPGLEEMIRRNMRQKRLSFTTDAATAVEQSLFIFIAVGTPPGEDGSADLQYVLTVAQTIGQHMDAYKVIVDKSTVPVGTADKVKSAVTEALSLRKADLPFDVVSNPEFLREGAAIRDFMEPDRVVIGSDSEKSIRLMKELYAPFMSQKDRLIVMNIRSAEMTKYAANSMLAAKISFMNEIAGLCEKVGANVDDVRIGIGTDNRIGPSFLFPGIGYGGSCFPKDVQALIRTGQGNGCDMRLLQSVEAVNYEQKKHLVDMITACFGQDLSHLKIGVWGLSFKPQTDDMREAPSLVVITELLNRGAKIIAHDPAAMEETKKILGSKIEYREYSYDVLEDADALCILTEWNDYRRPDFERMTRLLKSPVIFDGRNLFSPYDMKEKGFTYFSIGRPAYGLNDV